MQFLFVTSNLLTLAILRADLYRQTKKKFLLICPFQRLDEENKEQRRTNNSESFDDDDDCEIEEELEGANNSLNLNDAAALERLPQLTSTPGARIQKVDSLVVNSSHLEDTNLSPSSSSRPSDAVVNHVQHKHSQSEKTKSVSMAPEVRQEERKHRSHKHSNVPENHAEDLVVLSFSSSTGQ